MGGLSPLVLNSGFPLFPLGPHWWEVSALTTAPSLHPEKFAYDSAFFVLSFMVDIFLCKGQLNKVEVSDLGRSNLEII